MALNHTNTGADQRKSWARTPALTRTTHGPLKNEYSPVAGEPQQFSQLRPGGIPAGGLVSEDPVQNLTV